MTSFDLGSHGETRANLDGESEHPSGLADREGRIVDLVEADAALGGIGEQAGDAVGDRSRDDPTSRAAVMSPILTVSLIGAAKTSDLMSTFTVTVCGGCSFEPARIGGSPIFRGFTENVHRYSTSALMSCSQLLLELFPVGRTDGEPDMPVQ